MFISFIRPLRYGVDHLDTLLLPLPLRCRPLFPLGLSVGTHNIQNGWGSGLAKAICAVQIGSFDVMLLTKTKITIKAYFNKGCYSSI